MTEFEPTLNTHSLGFAEQMYADYQHDPASVGPDWRRYFEELAQAGGNGGPVRLGPSFAPPRLFNPPGGNGAAATAAAGDIAVRQDKVDQLVRAYRVRGHLVAQLDPLGRPRPSQVELDLGYYGLTDADLNQEFSAATVTGGKSQTLRALVDRLRNTYTRSIGVQFMHIDDLDVKRWLQDRMESSENRLALGRAEQMRILTKLTDAVIFEEFIQKKYLGAKSFSLEGAESLIPMLDLAIEKAGDQGVEEIVLGMAHRGRLNVLANIMGKSARTIFREFDDRDPELYLGSGDVKYHLGHSNDWTTSSGKRVHLTLAFNPSHLEYVNTVAQGRTRAKQDRNGDTARQRRMTVLIHGDAAFAGEGIVQETLNLSELPGYTVGGTLHIVINNQIGFTTTPDQARSSTYATDVAKMLQSPIFHVNGEDPEAVAQVIQLAMDFRQAFQRDVVIDLYAFRRFGHNESDEPQFTQPLMYKAIAQRESVQESYLRQLLNLGGITRAEAEQIEAARREHLENELSAARAADFKAHTPWLGGYWEGYSGGPEPTGDDPDTGLPLDQAKSLLAKTTQLPDGFTPHKKIERFFEGRRQMATGEKPLDWSAAEALAFGSLVVGGTRVRMTGQDVQRGTFSHRHAVLHDVVTGQSYMPLGHLSPEQAPIELYNSALSESGVLGFEYGYSLDYPDGLVLWEAQFGDFANVAAPIIDQFIASAEDKWKRLSGLVMLLPHGMEGQGPEHSSARLERFLNLVARDNMQIVQPSTPAQYFHMLRRQVFRPWRKPLVVMTPKSLLRLPACVSELAEFTSGTFQRVIPDSFAEPGKVTRVLLCSGKVYYEIDRLRRESGRTDVAVVRLEQLYPLPEEQLRQAFAAYTDGTPVYWVQDEPENMGAWRFLHYKLGERLFGRLPFSGVTRPESSSPASGSASAHRLEEERLMSQAFGNTKKEIPSNGR